MTVRQSAVTVMAEIASGHEPALRQLLEDAGQDTANSSLLPFGALTTVHFARFFLMDAAYDLQGRPLSPRLVLLASVDGNMGDFFDALSAVAGDGLHTIFGHCLDYPGRDGLVAFLARHSLPASASYVNTVGRTVDQVRREASLRAAIQGYLDRTNAEWKGKDPRQVRAGIQAFVAGEPTLAWARQPPPPPAPADVLRENLHLWGTIVGALLISPYIVVGLPIWLYLLRRHEKTDVARDVTPDDRLVQALAAQQDHGVQNPFTSAGYLKPGPFRRFTASLVLWGTDFLARHLFNHANLIGVKTIHFAQWVFIDDKRRVLFASNYDGSLENYMDDFIDKIAWGLNATFSNGVDYPRTNWLVLDGARDEEVFKRFNLTHQLVTPFWYTAYQGLTALNIENNARIHADLYGELDLAATRAWLRRF